MSRGEAAVHRERLAGQERGAIACQQACGAGDLLGPAGAAQLPGAYDRAMLLRLVLLAAVLAAAGSGPVLPGPLRDLDGAEVDIARLATEARVFLITMKSPVCPVCAQQLARLEHQRPGLELCGARFVVLAPGPAERIRAARRATGLEARWVEDPDGSLARALDLVLGPGQMVPAILEIDAAGRVTWQQRGRNGAYFGDGELQKHLRCEQRDT